MDPREHVAGRSPGRVVAIGNFDGVHRGHQAVLAGVSATAARLGLDPAVLTFAPHPLAVLGRPLPPLLTALERKLDLLRRAAPPIVPFVRRFDRAFAALPPEEFVAGTLVGHLDARVVVVGENFRFGHQRRGDFAALTRLGAEHGFETRSHGLLGDDTGAWSSSRIRETIARGDVDDASRMLGRPHAVTGLVVEGDRRGRTIGFPTANIAEVEEALPPNGVYAVLVDRAPPSPEPSARAPSQELVEAPSHAGAAALARGVANIGVRPTVKTGETRPSVEVHLFDRCDDLYGARLRVHLVSRLRAEQRFAGLQELKAQIARDADQARRRLDALVPDPAADGAWR